MKQVLAMVQSLGGNKVAEFRFEREGDEVKIYMSEDVSQIFTIQENGDLMGPAGMKLTLKE